MSFKKIIKKVLVVLLIIIIYNIIITKRVEAYDVSFGVFNRVTKNKGASYEFEKASVEQTKENLKVGDAFTVYHCSYYRNYGMPEAGVLSMAIDPKTNVKDGDILRLQEYGYVGEAHSYMQYHKFKVIGVPDKDITLIYKFYKSGDDQKKNAVAATYKIKLKIKPMEERETGLEIKKIYEGYPLFYKESKIREGNGIFGADSVAKAHIRKDGLVSDENGEIAQTQITWVRKNQGDKKVKYYETDKYVKYTIKVNKDKKVERYLKRRSWNRRRTKVYLGYYNIKSRKRIYITI